MSDYTELRRLAGAATHGPWVHQAHFIENTNCVPNPYRSEGSES